MASRVIPSLKTVESKTISMIHVPEDFSREILREAIVEVGAEQDELDGFLLDLRDAWNALDTSTAYRFAYEELGKLNFPRALRGAIVCKTGDSAQEFLSVVAQNASYNWRHFGSEDEALAWLSS